MIQNLIAINEYGIFVWLSFIITILTCTLFYIKTYKALRKHEKDFAKELNNLSAPQRKLVLEKSKIANQVLNSYNKSI